MQYIDVSIIKNEKAMFRKTKYIQWYFNSTFDSKNLK